MYEFDKMKFKYLGIAFVAQPTFIFGATEEDDVSHRDIGIVIALGSAVCAGAQYVIVNYTKKDCHWLQVEQVTSALSTFILCPLAALCFSLYFYGKTGEFKLEFVTLSAGTNSLCIQSEIGMTESHQRTIWTQSVYTIQCVGWRR